MSTIKRYFYLTLVVLLTFTSLFSTVSINPVYAEETDASTFLFEADFNNETTGERPADFDVSEGGGTVEVTEVPDTSNKSVFLSDTSETADVKLSKSFDELVGVVTVQMKFMQPKYTSSTKVMRVKGDGTPIIIETKDNNISYRTGSTYEPLVPLEENVWYDIKTEIDLINQTANVYINGELKLENAQLNEPATKISYFETFTPGSKALGHYVDDIKISGSLPEVDPEQPTDPEDPSEPTPPTEPGAGGIYEAEDGKLVNAIIDNKHPGFTGTGFVDMVPNAPGGSIEWTIDVPVGGEYTLDFRYAHGGTDERPGEIKVNGEIVEPKLAFNPTGGFANWTYTSTKATFQAGENVIVATGIGASGGANIDHLKVYMEYDQIYEAEDALLDETGVIIDNQHTGFTGTGFIDYKPNQPGSWVEWTVNVPTDGEYFLDFRYASGGTDARPAEIKVNDEVVTESLAFDPTGAWTTWVYTSTKATLKAGENKIRATGVGTSGGANIDHLRIHNKETGSDEGPIDTEDSEVKDIVSGLYLKKLNELGVIVEKQPEDTDSITRLEFMSLINSKLGLAKEEQFKGLSTESEVWEVSLNEWYSYVLAAAKQAGYMDALVRNGKIQPNKTLKKKEAVKIIQELNGSTTIADNNKELTWGEAKNLVNTLPSEEQRKTVQIADVHAISSNLIAVTLNSSFDEFDFSDISVVYPTGNWTTLSPNFKNLRIDKAAKGKNKFGQTVLILNSLDELDQNGKYIVEPEKITFKGDLNDAIRKADNLLTWQMENGGWTKNWPHIYERPWDGKEPRSEWVANGVELGTIDNDATIKEILFLAEVYRETGDKKYKDSIEKGFEFLFQLQYDTGGFAQVYPRRGNYSDYVTFNDEAMINVLEMMDDVVEKRYPFDSDVINDSYGKRIKLSIKSGIDYILKAQIKFSDGTLTAWGAQHDPYTFEPQKARAYEHASVSGSESIGIIRFLMSRPQTDEIKKSVRSALEWLDEVKLENTRYVSGDPNNVYFVEDSNSTAWYRFYEIGTNRGIFSGRDGVIKYDIMEIEEERRNGYSWGGHWGTKLLSTAEETGYFTNNVYIQVVGSNSKDLYDRQLEDGDIKVVKSLEKQISQIENEIFVAKDGTGDYATIQAAIDAIPANNTTPITIFIKNGVYKEVVTVPNNKPFITMIGEDPVNTIITFDNFAGRDNGVGGTLGTSGSASVYLRANDFRVENVTFENSFDESSTDVSGKQAVAVYAAGERQYFKNVRFIGNQDTLYVHSGTQYYNQVYVEGDVDFIFGAARVVFEDSIIHSLNRGSDSNNGYITAASTLITDQYGILIKDSKLTSNAPAGTVYLGRPWPAGGNPNAIGSVVIMNSELGDHIKTEGWTSMSGLNPEDARLFEYKNYGPGAAINESRRQLTDEEAANWTVQNVLKGWDPTEGEDCEKPGNGPKPGKGPKTADGQNPGNNQIPGYCKQSEN
ncbi:MULTISPECIES: pectate lyase [unclassified Fredinandcohnia]|uniref:pectate lyase n=1 Tax=unclassified Fredinandcohnia TaxID=2837514 RepID=UPI0030FD9D67